MKRSKAGKHHERETRTWLRSFGNHPVNVLTIFAVSVLGFIVSVLSLVYLMYGPFNLLPKSEPPVTTQERAYAELARDAMKDGAALMSISSEPPHLRDKFESPDYINLRRRVADELQQLRETEPSDRLRALHPDVILFLEKAQESAALMSRYSYSLDHDTFNRAADASGEAMRATNRVTAGLKLITVRLNKGY